mgnify:CR=1 FL=1
MKKSLIALAVLAASGAAMAQSSVTLFGKANIGYAKTGTAQAAMTGGADGSGGIAGREWPDFGLCQGVAIWRCAQGDLFGGDL